MVLISLTPRLNKIKKGIEDGVIRYSAYDVIQDIKKVGVVEKRVIEMIFNDFIEENTSLYASNPPLQELKNKLLGKKNG